MFRKRDAQLAERDQRIASLQRQLHEAVAGRMVAESTIRNLERKAHDQVSRLRKELDVADTTLRSSRARLAAERDSALLRERRAERARQLAASAAGSYRQMALAGVVEALAAKTALQQAEQELTRRTQQAQQFRSLEQALEVKTDELRRERSRRVDLEAANRDLLNEKAELEQLLRDAATSDSELLPKIRRLRQYNRQLSDEKAELLERLVSLGGDFVVTEDWQ